MGWQLCKMVVFGLMRLIGIAGEGLGCFLANSSKTVDSPTGVERGKNELRDCSVRSRMVALILPGKPSKQIFESCQPRGCSENAVDVAGWYGLQQAECQYHPHTRGASDAQDT